MKNKSKILFSICNLTYGGIQTQALALAKEYKARGAQVYFFWTEKYEDDFVNKELYPNGFKIINGQFINDKFWAKYSWRLYRYMPLIKAVILIRFYNFDYIIPYQNKLCYFFGSISRYTGAKKTIFHIRNTVLENEPRKNWQFKKALNNHPVIITNSNHARLKFQKIYGSIYDFEIKTIHNGIKLRKVDDSKDWRSFFNVNDYKFIVTSIANFFQEKDYSTIFKAWKLFLSTTDANAVLLVAGDEGKPGMMDYYKSEVEQLGIKKNVKFLGRTSYNIELLSISNCNILSTLNEGLPNVVIESIGVGVPFIGTNIDGIKEVVGEDYPIPLFERENYVELKNILIKLYLKKIDLKKQQKYSLKRFKMFSVERMINEYSKIIDI